MRQHHQVYAVRGQRQVRWLGLQVAVGIGTAMNCDVRGSKPQKWPAGGGYGGTIGRGGCCVMATGCAAG